MESSTPSRGGFWAWYERNYVINVVLASGLFLLQIVHLYWLTTHVVLHLALGKSFFDPHPAFQLVLVAVDYTEIPALIGASLIYLYDLRQRFRWKSVLFLLFLNSQWLHLFWITDEFVIEQFLNAERSTVLPLWLAWLAIGIDYLELPVIVDTIRRVVMIAVKADSAKQALRKLSKFYVLRH